MAWLVVDEDGTELLFTEITVDKINNRRKSSMIGGFWCRADLSYITLPKSSIQKIIGRKLTWDDEPVELKELK